MQQFPDERTMALSEKGDDVIRGGSVGLNRVLSKFVHDAGRDRKPQCNAVLLNAFTFFRNVVVSKDVTTLRQVEDGFVQDVTMFLDYFDTYLDHVWKQFLPNYFCPVIMYFPDYHKVSKTIRRELTGQKEEQAKLYKTFLDRHGGRNAEVKKLEHSRCFWIKVGDNDYPHRELLRKFREITVHKECLYSSGDPIYMLSHVLLDRHIAHRLSGVSILESHTARVIPPKDFGLKLDPSGNIPFTPLTHGIFGDDHLIKPEVQGKIKKELLESAEKDHWKTRSEGEIRQRITKIAHPDTNLFAHFNF